MYSVFIILHVLCGSTALLTGIFSVMSKKGGRFHRGNGRFFFYAMLGTTLSSMILAIIHPSYFLWCIGIFSFYQNFMGFRAIRNKTLQPKWYDHLVLGISAINTIMMLVVLHPILFVFGLISLGTVAKQYLLYYRLRTTPAQAKEWLQIHIGNMMGAFIATVTAFLVVNGDNLSFSKWQATFIWFVPTIALVPLMAFWMKKYKGEAPKTT